MVKEGRKWKLFKEHTSEAKAEKHRIALQMNVTK